jgi:hypothetical protein
VIPKGEPIVVILLLSIFSDDDIKYINLSENII